MYSISNPILLRLFHFHSLACYTRGEVLFVQVLEHSYVARACMHVHAMVYFIGE